MGKLRVKEEMWYKNGEINGLSEPMAHFADELSFSKLKLILRDVLKEYTLNNHERSKMDKREKWKRVNSKGLLALFGMILTMLPAKLYNLRQHNVTPCTVCLLGSVYIPDCKRCNNTGWSTSKTCKSCVGSKNSCTFRKCGDFPEWKAKLLASQEEWKPKLLPVVSLSVVQELKFELFVDKILTLCKDIKPAQMDFYRERIKTVMSTILYHEQPHLADPSREMEFRQVLVIVIARFYGELWKESESDYLDTRKFKGTVHWSTADKLDKKLQDPRWNPVKHVKQDDCLTQMMEQRPVGVPDQEEQR